MRQATRFRAWRYRSVGPNPFFTNSNRNGFLKIKMSTTTLKKTVVDQQRAAIVHERIFPALCAALLGAALIFGAGFSSKMALHNAAHDTRHAAGFPCH